MSLHSQANELLAGTPRIMSSVLRRLRGFPIVVNEWASWCPACVFELPAFQRAALKYGAHVAFIGLDVADSGADATALLAKFPLTYPSYTDPDTEIAQSLEASGYYPQTLYFDRRGKLVFDHGGGYANTAALERDVRRYGLA